MDLIQATNTPVTLKLGGTDYKVRFLNFRELAVVSVWIEEHVPSPLARAAQAIAQLHGTGKTTDSSTEELLLDHASNQMLSWPPRVGSKAWFDALDGADGGLAELVHVILSKTVPGFDREKAQALTEKLEATEVVELVYLGVLGVRPKKAGIAVEQEPPPSILEEAVLETAAATAATPTPPGPNWGVWRE